MSQKIPKISRKPWKLEEGHEQILCHWPHMVKREKSQDNLTRCPESLEKLNINS